VLGGKEILRRGDNPWLYSDWVVNNDIASRIWRRLDR